MPHPSLRRALAFLALLWIASPAAADDGSLRGTFLVADPQLQGPPFERSVILVIEHSDEGAHGLIVNQPTEATLADVLPEPTPETTRDHRLHMGGPVRLDWLALLVRTRDDGQGLDQVLPEVAYAAARTAFDAVLAASPGPDNIRAFAGYAGWAPDQLEHEIQRGDWHVLPAEADQVFTPEPGNLWRELYEQVEGDSEGGPLRSI